MHESRNTTYSIIHDSVAADTRLFTLMLSADVLNVRSMITALENMEILALWNRNKNHYICRIRAAFSVTIVKTTNYNILHGKDMINI